MTIPRTPPSVILKGTIGAAMRARLGNLPKPQEDAPLVARRRRPTAGTAASPLALGAAVDPGSMDAEPLSSLIGAAWRSGYREPRGQTYTHVSSLLTSCMRKKALVARDNIATAATRLSLAEALTYAQGDAIHDVIKARAAAGGPSLVWGKWKCKCGHLRVETPCTLLEAPALGVCPHCDFEPTIYDEVEAIDEEHAIIGHPDLLLWLPNLRALYVTELKSIAADAFKDLVRPKPDHVLQALFYWYLLRKEGRAVVDRLSLLYVTKGHTFRGNPYKEFTVTPSLAVSRLEPYLVEAAAVKAATTGGPMPNRTRCVSPDSTEARACEARNACFADPKAPAPVTFSFAAALRA